MNNDKKLWAMDTQEFAEYAKTASKAELAEYKEKIPPNTLNTYKQSCEISRQSKKHSKAQATATLF